MADGEEQFFQPASLEPSKEQIGSVNEKVRFLISKSPIILVDTPFIFPKLAVGTKDISEL